MNIKTTSRLCKYACAMFAICMLDVLCPSLLSAASQESHMLWYDQPAPQPVVEEEYRYDEFLFRTLPIGNGSLGGAIYGGIEMERILLNVDSLWVGNENKTGSYQSLGSLFITFDNLKDKTPENYKRSLDISTALHNVSFEIDGNTYTRETFCSQPDQVMAMRFVFSKPTSGTIYMQDQLSKSSSLWKIENGKRIYASRKSSSITSSEQSVIMTGQLVNDLLYEARVNATAKKGSINATPDGKLKFSKVTELTLLLAADTDYAMDRAKKWRGTKPQEKNQNRLQAASEKSWEELKKRHVTDYKNLYDRVSLDFAGSGSRENIPTEKRQKAYKGSKEVKPAEDPDFEELVFHYARYLLISSSRKGTLPANLQGIWNHFNKPPWNSDYHGDVNVQMNYWFAEHANLGSCHMSFINYVMAMREEYLVQTKAEVIHPNGKKALRGWTVGLGNNIFGSMNATRAYPASAWYTQHFYEHYAFTQDKEYLRKTAYPVLKEMCEFWEDRLKERPDGTLVVPEGWSPEHGPKNVDGASFDQQIVYDLFGNYIEASEDLDIDKEYRASIADMRARLLAPKIGRWGQLQEWEEDIDDPKCGHRHMSHLFALHPGRQISPFTTPELAKAAETSLKSRG
ncbi:glycoside hydrolase N-terminal domain-containing protein, partial [Verrucomicrobiota bacterium]